MKVKLYANVLLVATLLLFGGCKETEDHEQHDPASEIEPATNRQPADERRQTALLAVESTAPAERGESFSWIAVNQFVDIKAMDRIDEIMAVDGLDFVLFGPSDFSVSIGHPGEGTHPKVMEALRETIKAANRHGKYVCKGVGYPFVNK